jgi:hypothetical protein
MFLVQTMGSCERSLQMLVVFSYVASGSDSGGLQQQFAFRASALSGPWCRGESLWMVHAKVYERINDHLIVSQIREANQAAVEYMSCVG